MEPIIIQVSVQDLVVFSFPASVLVLILAWLLKNWIGARIDKSIQYEYDTRLEEYKFSQLQRQKAEVVARLFAKWKKYHGNEGKYLEPRDLINYYEELNQMSLELSIWLPDTNILNDIMKILETGNNLDKARTVREVVGEIRKIILDNKRDEFDPKNIILWDNKIKEVIDRKN